uniref:Uncharacterized protein n=1 Tax=Ditylenchus dipsaci TaxID=166011 RepID=A0A915CPR6_9BILA
MGDRSAYMSPGGYSAPSNPGGKSGSSGGGGGGYAREDYAWGGSSGGGGSSNSNAGGGGGASSNAGGGGGKPKTDVSCYLGPKFYNPCLISKREKLIINGEKPATLKDIIDDWKRCFQRGPGSSGPNRFSTFHWWITAFWTAQANRQELVYSNGTFFAETSINTRNMAEDIVKKLVNPMQKLQTNTVENCILFAIALFHNYELLPLSQNSITSWELTILTL